MTTVDAALFDSLQAAIDFVAGCGGGIVYTELSGTIYAKCLKVPLEVKLEAVRRALVLPIEDPAA